MMHYDYKYIALFFGGKFNAEICKFGDQGFRVIEVITSDVNVKAVLMERAYQ